MKARRITSHSIQTWNAVQINNGQSLMDTILSHFPPSDIFMVLWDSCEILPLQINNKSAWTAVSIYLKCIRGDQMNTAIKPASSYSLGEQSRSLSAIHV